MALSHAERQRRYRERNKRPLVRIFLTPEQRVVKARANAKRWQRANPEKKREIEAAWRSANPERSREIAREACRRYRLRHPEVATQIAVVRRRAMRNTPRWAEKEKILEVYRQSKRWGMEVDHIVPLKHPLVCGLHVWANLQLLDCSLNRAKRNKEWPDMPTNFSQNVTPQITTGSSITEE